MILFFENKFTGVVMVSDDYTDNKDAVKCLSNNLYKGKLGGCYKLREASNYRMVDLVDVILEYLVEEELLAKDFKKYVVESLRETRKDCLQAERKLNIALQTISNMQKENKQKEQTP